MMHTQTPALYPAHDALTPFLDSLNQDVASHLQLNRPGRLPLERLGCATRLDHAPASLDDPAWDQAPAIGPFLCWDRGRFNWAQACDARLAFDDQHLSIRLHASGPCGRATFDQSWSRADNFQLILDTAHDHLHYIHLAIVPDGRLFASRCRRPYDSQRWEAKFQEEEIDASAVICESRAEPWGWSAVVRVPFAWLGKGPGQRWGFNCFHNRVGLDASPSFWNPLYDPYLASYSAGQLCFESLPALHLAQVDLGRLQAGEQACQVHLSAFGAEPIRGTITMRVDAGDDAGEPFWQHAQPLTSAGASEWVERLPLRWYAREHRHHRLALAIHVEGYDGCAAVYRFGREEGRLLQLAPPAESKHTNPIPGTPGFIEHKRDQILTRLPEMRRLTTAQGAEGDFVLASITGEPRFNLMQGDAMRQIADYLYNLFDNDIDRLIGSAFFVNQPPVFTYANSPSPLVSQLSPLSLLRFGCGQCCCFASVQIGILEQMRCDRTGKPYRATRVCVPGHVITAVEFDGRWVVLDPSLGRFYFLPGDRALATMEQLLADPSIAGRSGHHLESFHAKGAAKPDTPHYYPAGVTIWPPGAPDDVLPPDLI